MKYSDSETINNVILKILKISSVNIIWWILHPQINLINPVETHLAGKFTFKATNNSPATLLKRDWATGVFLVGKFLYTVFTEHVSKATADTSQGTNHVDSTSVLRQYVEGQISTNCHAISTCFFDVISLIEKSTSFPRTFLDANSIVEKSTSFPRTYFDVIRWSKNPHCFHAFFSM